MDIEFQDMSSEKVREAFIDGTIDMPLVNPIEMACLLRIAIMKNDTTYATAILDKVPDILLHDNGGGRILWQAMESGNEIMARKLILAGADLNYRSRNGSNFLHCFMSEYESLAILMIEHGADINITNCAGDTVLYTAVREGLKMIVDAIAKLDIHYEDENRILKEAASSNKMAHVLPSLIESSDDATKMVRARKVIPWYLEAKTKNKADMNLIRQLIDAALTSNRTETEIVQILKSVVVFREHTRVARLLLEGIENLNGKSEDVASLLCSAVKHTHSMMSVLLIQKGANVNQCTKDQDYPLHYACRDRSLQNLHILLSLGADIKVTDNLGRTPFSYMTTDSFHEHHKLVLRHLAIASSMKLTIDANDLAKINRYSRMRSYYEECLNELENMKETKIYEDNTFFCFFSKNLEELCALTRHVIFLRTYYLNQKEGSVLFPRYSTHMHNLFKMAIERKNFMIEVERTYEEAAVNLPPYGIIYNLANDMSELEDFERKFYFRLHGRINSAKERSYTVHLLH